MLNSGGAVITFIHDTPETWSDERRHVLGESGDCWCGEVWHFPGDGTVRVEHRRKDG